MSTFSAAELDYLDSQPLGRVATVDASGRPHVMPVGVFHDPATDSLVIGSVANMAASKKFRDAAANPHIAVVVDDLARVEPWTPRGIEVRGRVVAHTGGGAEVGKRVGASFSFDDAYLEVRPRRIIAWGIDSDSFSAVARDVA